MQETERDQEDETMKALDFFFHLDIKLKDNTRHSHSGSITTKTNTIWYNVSQGQNILKPASVELAVRPEKQNVATQASDKSHRRQKRKRKKKM